jgi:hypothetical protein
LVWALCGVGLAQVGGRIPPEVRIKSGYVNPAAKPADFHAVMLWGIAIADTRVRGFERARVEIARTQLSCRVNGGEVLLNDDAGDVHGGLFRRFPWFGSDEHEPIPLVYLDERSAAVLRVGTRPDRIWHFWSASPRAGIPSGELAGCTVMVRARISRGALLQVGFDYWRDQMADYGAGGNNHEAGASGWYFSSPDWQAIRFSDIRR